MTYGLIADIGGTNARFALVDSDARISNTEVYHTNDYASLSDALASYFEQTSVKSPPKQAAICAAGPVKSGSVKITNNPWSIDGRSLPFDRLHLLNDFQAVAHALPHLTADDLICLRSGCEEKTGTRLAIGPGTGLGVAALLSSGQTVTSEAGHVGIAGQTTAEDDFLAKMRLSLGFVEVEHVVSGFGIQTVYRVLSGRDEKTGAAEIAARARSGIDPAAVQTMDFFFGFLGRFAGDMAMAFNATGGVYLAGGVLPKVQDMLTRSRMLDFMVEKGRFSGFVHDVPVHLITHPLPAFVGLASILAKGNSTA